MTKVTADIQGTVIMQKVGLKKGGKAHKFITNEIYRVSEPYTPRKEGALYRQITMDADGGGYTHNVPYARKHWYDWGKANFRGAPLRGNKWTQRAFLDNKQALMTSLDKFISKEGG